MKRSKNRLIQRVMNTSSLETLSDDQLLAEVKRLASAERAATVALVRSLMEVDARRLYLREGCSSLFTYCTHILHLAEGAAYNRIETARAARRFPQLLEALASSSITLTTARLLAPHLTADNCQQLLRDAHHKTKRDIELLVAMLHPSPAVAPTLRKVPALTSRPLTPVSTSGGSDVGRCAPESSEPTAAVPSEAVAADVAEHIWTRSGPATAVTIPGQPRGSARPFSSAAYKLHLTISAGTHTKLRRAQDMLRHSIPDGDLAAILDRALALLVTDLDRRRCAAVSRPRPEPGESRPTRHVPAAVRREVWRRDQGRCAFVGTSGRCCETGFWSSITSSPTLPAEWRR